MGFRVTEFFHLFDLQASIFVGDKVYNGHPLVGRGASRALRRAGGL